MAREALSARIDGEREPVPAPRVDDHLAACAPCRAWQAAAVAQTQHLRRLAGRSQLAAVPAVAEQKRRRTAAAAAGWRRWALAAVGLVQVGLAAAQGLGAQMGLGSHLGGHTGGHAHADHAGMMGHVLNESTAWSAALGVVMLAAALRPAAAAGLAWVLGVFAVLLTGYVIRDAAAGAVTLDRVLTHLPVVVGAVLAFLVWRRDVRQSPGSDDTAVRPDAALPARDAGRRRPGSAA